MHTRHTLALDMLAIWYRYTQVPGIACTGSPDNVPSVGRLLGPFPPLCVNDNSTLRICPRHPLNLNVVVRSNHDHAPQPSTIVTTSKNKITANLDLLRVTAVVINLSCCRHFHARTVRPCLMQSDSASRKRPFSTGLFFDWILLVLLLIVSRVDFLVFVLFLEAVGVREHCCTAVEIGWQLCASRCLRE